jgi:TetR/AcrR family transcriptional regulator, fatty acid metabolism regulator protein
MTAESKSEGLTPDTDVFRGSSKRERILRAAIEVFATHGYFKAKISEVARAAGVADGTIYLYFTNKEDLLVTIFREHTRSFIEALEAKLADVAGAEEKLRIAIGFHLETLGRDRALAVVSQVELRHSLKFMSLFSQEEFGDYLGVIRSIVEQGQEEGVFSDALHPQLVAKAIFGILDEMVTSWMLSEKEYDLAGQSGGVARLILTGLLDERVDF